MGGKLTPSVCIDAVLAGKPIGYVGLEYGPFHPPLEGFREVAGWFAP